MCVCVCNPFLKQWRNLLSVDRECTFLLRQIKKNLSFSLDWSLSRVFLSCSLEDRVLWLILLHGLFSWKIWSWNLNPSLGWSLIVFQWVKSASSSLCLARCVFTSHSWYRTKKLWGHLLFLLLRISNLTKGLFFNTSPCRSGTALTYSLVSQLIVDCVSMQERCWYFLYAFQLRLYTAHTVRRDFSAYESRLDIQYWDISPLTKTRRISLKITLGFSD